MTQTGKRVEREGESHGWKDFTTLFHSSVSKSGRTPSPSLSLSLAAPHLQQPTNFILHLEGESTPFFLSDFPSAFIILTLITTPSVKFHWYRKYKCFAKMFFAFFFLPIWTNKWLKLGVPYQCGQRISRRDFYDFVLWSMKDRVRIDVKRKRERGGKRGKWVESRKFYVFFLFFFFSILEWKLPLVLFLCSVSAFLSFFFFCSLSLSLCFTWNFHILSLHW